MNLAQMRVALKSILTAGGGANSVIKPDAYWSDKELNTYLNMGQNEVYKIIRRARSDYFTRVVRTTDPPFLVRGVLFDPSSLKWVPGKGSYVLPPDFVRIKLITDLSATPIRFTHADIARNEFKILMNSTAGVANGEYLYDILGVRTMLVRPLPIDERDFEFVYEHNLAPLRDYTRGQVTATDGNTTVTFTDDAKIQQFVEAGDELIIGTLQEQAIPDVDYQYPIIRSIDSPSQATLESAYYEKENT